MFNITDALFRTCIIGSSTIYHTPDRDFRYFYPCEIFLSYIPVPALGKDKNRTSARRPHAGRMSILDVIVMLKGRHYVASQQFQDFLEVFFIFSNIKCGT